MSSKPIEFDAKLLKILSSVVKSHGEASWDQVAHDLGLNPFEATKLVLGVKEARAELLAKTGQDQDVHQAFRWDEWCQMVHLLEEWVRLPSTAEAKMILMPLLKQFREHPAYSVYLQFRLHWQNTQISDCGISEDPHVAAIEAAICHEETLEMEWEDKGITVVPVKLTHVESRLHLIAEDLHEGGLLAFPMDEIKHLQRAKNKRAPRTLQQEVEIFVRALRSMNEIETRLILKIKDPISFMCQPEYHFLGKPCLVSNPDGEVIWAAYVEPCDGLFDWLDGQEENVEILDPPSFIMEFTAYCEVKRRKLA